MWKMLMKGITINVPESVGEKKQNKKTVVFFLQYGAANGNMQHSQTTCSID